MGWPTDWDEQVTGTGCRMCARPRSAESDMGLRVHASARSDAYLMREALVPGYVVVVWRGRHVVEPYELDDDEAAGYQRDVLRVARALAAHFRPLKVNYQTLGNRVPHLHTHVTPRYRDGDPAPGGPLPDGPNVRQPERRWRADAAALRALLRAGAGGRPAEIG